MSDAHHDNHGQTPAAWTAVIIIMVASVVATLGVVLGNWPMFWVGMGLVVVGAVVGKVMAMAGLGKQPKADAEGRHREPSAAAGE
jgi:predicted membrane channel-forming protein YqfA (hemolysin III family)